MKQFMFVFRGGDSHYATVSPEVKQRDMEKWFAWIENLKKSGKYLSGQPLDIGGKVVYGKKVTDGPFAEGKELVGGYFLIHAKDIEEASEMARDCPSFSVGIDGASVEVRPIMEM